MASQDPSVPIDSATTLPPPGDAEAAVEALVRGKANVDSGTLPVLATPALDPALGRLDIPNYEVLGELGRGGMGVVYKARQLRPSRLVALKMVLAGAHASAQELMRFLAEAEAIAKLQHPNIVQIFEFGKRGEQPFFSLEFCDGGSLAGKLAGTPLPPREAAELVATLAEAIEAAHGAGIIHRDLKPHNVLLLADGTPKITDFGLAKQAGSDLTASGAIMGTPSYMAPEQADPRKGTIGPSADVYALGAILYECLTGRPPFRAATPIDTILQVVHDEPAPPSQLNPKTPRDLETIALRCLQKEAKQRYASAAALAQDLQRYLNDEPILARPIGRWERMYRWCRKYPAAAALLVLSTLFGLIMFYLFGQASALRENEAEARQQAVAALGKSQKAEANAVEERNRADQEADVAKRRAKETKDALDDLQSERDKAKQVSYAFNIGGAYADWQLLNAHRARQQLQACAENMRGWEWEFLRKQFEESSLPLRGHTNGCFAVALSADGGRACTLGLDRTVRVWDALRGIELRTVPVQGHLLALSPDGKFAAVAVGRGVVVRDLENDREVRRFDAGNLPVGLGFVLGGKQLGVATLGGDVTFRDPETGGTLKTLPKIKLDPATQQLINLSHGVTFSSDGKWLAQGGEHLVHVWEAATGKVHFEGKGHIKLVGQVAFRPDGKQLASPGGEGDIRIWDVEKKELVRKLHGHKSWAMRVAWNADGTRLISCAKDTTARVWDPETGATLLTLRGHAAEVWGCALSADGNRAATASPDGTARIWDTRPRALYGEHVAKFFHDNKLEDFGRHGLPEFLTFFSHVAPCGDIALSPDGRLAATSAMGDDQAKHQITVWDLDARREVMKIEAPQRFSHPLAFSRDGKRLAIGIGADKKGEPSRVRVVSVPDGKEVWQWEGPGGVFPCVQFAPRAKQLAITIQATVLGRPQVSPDGKCWLIVVDAETGKEHYRHELPGTATPARFSGDGGEIVCADAGQAVVYVYEATTGKNLRSWKASNTALSDVACGPKGIVATASSAADGGAVISLWRLADGGKLRELTGHVGVVLQMTFNPEGTRLLSCASDFTARLWHVDSGREMLTFRDHADIPLAVAWSGDGRRIATGCKDGGLRVWDGPTTSAAVADAWTELYWDDFADPAKIDRWGPLNGSRWEIQDGVLRGRHIQVTKPVEFSMAYAQLNKVELPKYADITFKYRMSKPMVLGVTFGGITTGGVMSYTPLLAAPCRLAGSPTAFLLKVTMDGPDLANIKTAPVGLPRRFDAEAKQWHRVRVLREPTKISVWFNDALMIQENIPDLDLPKFHFQGSWSDVGDVIEFADLVIKTRADAAREQELRALVRQTFPKVLLRDETIQRIAAEHAISPADRAILERLVLEHREEPLQIGEAAWSVSKRPGAPAEAMGLAVRQCEAVVRLRPDSYEDWGALSLARLRAGQIDRAAADAQKALAMSRAQDGAGWPMHYAVLAMAQHRLGKSKEARHHLQSLRDVMLSDWWASRGIAQELLKEAEALLEAPAATDMEKEAAQIKRLILRAEQDGWLKHDVDAYLKLFTDDATVRDGRLPTPGPHDVILDRKKLEQIRRYQFRTPPPGDFIYFTCEDMAVAIRDDTAELKLRCTVHFGPNFRVTTNRYHLQREATGWRVKSAENWPLAEKKGAEISTYDAARWQTLDAAAEALTKSDDLEKRFLALREAQRHADGHALAVEATKKSLGNAGAWTDFDSWQVRGDLAFTLGNIEDARLAFKKAEELDPSQPLPWYTARLLRSFHEHKSSVGGVEFLPDGQRIFSTGADGVARLWNARTLKVIREFRGDGVLYGAAVPKDGALAVAGGKHAYVWKLTTGEKIFTSPGPSGKVQRLSFSPDGARLVATVGDGVAYVWDFPSGKVVSQIKDHGGELTFHPSGQAVLIAGQDGTAKWFDLESRTITRTLKDHDGEVKRVAFSPDGTRAATADTQHVVRIWDIQVKEATSSKPLLRLTGPVLGIEAVRFSPDGKRLAGCDAGGNVYLWDAAIGKLLRQLRTDGAAVFCVSFSPDGRTLAGGTQRGVLLWDLRDDPLGSIP